MKKLIIRTSLILVTTLFLVTACDKEIIMFDSSMNVVGFSSSAVVVKENLSGVATMYLGAAEGTAPTTLTLTVDTVGLGKSAAKEDIDFTLSSKSVPVAVGETTIDINPVDNSVFTGDKKFYLVITENSSGFRISAQKRLLVTISDDEHPLKNWIGTYSVAAPSYGSPGAWDESWTVLTAPVDGDITKLTLTGIGSESSDPIIATFDVINMTITIAPGQSLGDPYGAGTTEVYLGTVDLDLIESEPLVGTISNDGSIHVNFWGHKILDDPDWVWDVFNTTWTKQ